MTADRQGFRPCTLDEGAGPVLAQSEKVLVVLALLLHVLDVGVDVLVALLFLSTMQWGLLACSGCSILTAWVVSGLYVPRGSSEDGSPTRANESLADRAKQLTQNMLQMQIFAEAKQCVVHGGETGNFHTLRALEALLESGPNALVQVYALIVWAVTPEAPSIAVPLLRASVLISILSVGLGLAIWENKAQVRAPCNYILGVAVTRMLEIGSRTCTLAIFAALTQSYDGLWWVLVGDYLVLLAIIAKHRSVQLTYGFFVALPLVFVSLEPFVWRREYHVVPKDLYYALRFGEGVLLWAGILQSYSAMDSEIAMSIDVWVSVETAAIACTLGLIATLPFVWCAARRLELAGGDDDDVDDCWAGEDYDDEEVMNNNDDDDDDVGDKRTTPLVQHPHHPLSSSSSAVNGGRGGGRRLLGSDDHHDRDDDDDDERQEEERQLLCGNHHHHRMDDDDEDEEASMPLVKANGHREPTTPPE